MSITKDDMVSAAICVDCAHLLANGECDPDQAERVSEALARIWDGYHLTLGNIACDHPDRDCYCDQSWFSWTSCDGCESSLGGERFHAVAWPLVTV